MGITIVFTYLMMTIARIFGCQLLGPLHDVAVQAGLLVLDDDRCSEVHGRYKSQTFLDSTFTNDAFDVIGDGNDFFALFGIEGEIGGMGCAWDCSSSGSSAINVRKVPPSSWPTILLSNRSRPSLSKVIIQRCSRGYAPCVVLRKHALQYHNTFRLA
jgi:hypothetical protein